MMLAFAVMLMAVPSAAEGETMKSILTGEDVPVEIGRKRPVAIMFNNIYDAVPQYGLSHYGVCVEAEVEGLITRILGIMEDYKDCGRIGSVRSARNYYYYFSREFQSIYMHFGEAAYALPLLYLHDTIELSGLTEYGETVYYRSDDRVSPHNVFTNYEMIRAGIEQLDLDDDLPDWYDHHFRFAPEGEENMLEDGTIANVVLPGYGYNHARFDYNPQDGLYYRSQYGDAQIDADNGVQLTAKNIILQYCESTPFDENGYLWTDVVSGGSGKFITNGRCIDITWSKEDSRDDENAGFYCDIESPYLSVPVYTTDFSRTHYYDLSGNEVSLNRGQTWICLIRNSAANKVIVTDNTGIASDATDYIS